MLTDKTLINLVVIGNMDSGKSTTTGQMIYKCGGINEETIDHFELEAQELGEKNFKYSWILDKLKTEKDSGINTDMDLIKFETPDFNVTVIDAPGYTDFIKNMITGPSRANCALLIVSSANNDFEQAFLDNGQTKQQALLAYSLGIKKLIVGVNKMDPLFSQKRFNTIKKEITDYLKGVGYQTDSVAFVPISGLDGDNVVEESENMGWYAGWEVKLEDRKTVVKGKTLIDAIDKIKTPFQPWKKPFRLSVQDAFENGEFVTVVGRVETGIIRPGMEVTFAPQDLTVIVESVRIHPDLVVEARPLDEVRLNIRDVRPEDIWRGSVCSHPLNDPARQAIDFTAIVIVMNHPGQIIKGYTPILYCHAAQIACRFAELLKKINGRTAEVIQDSPDYLVSGDVAVIKMIPMEAMCVETFAEYPHFGLFTVRGENNQTILVGVIQSVTKFVKGKKPKKALEDNNEKIMVRAEDWAEYKALTRRSPSTERRPIGFA